MRICIPTETDSGLKAIVYAHFGSAPYFTIYDSEKDTFEVVENSNQHHAHGTCHPLGMLNGKHIDAVVCSGMGARAVSGLNGSGIRVVPYKGRSFAVYDGDELVCVTVYKKGANEVKRRLEMGLGKEAKPNEVHEAVGIDDVELGGGQIQRGL